ncbi:TRAP transporter permease [Bacillus sp. Marseille-P3661]|uniref:TRAP transporter permease n=1 Tax=Bacillus sp. Marseille-P3661 TaxID=1936234 RepID=UPI000C8267A0|nr:TRAP transporter permease [Bacillus sp. Marseille-P3661]
MFRIIVLVFTLALSIFTLYTAIFGLLTPVLQRSIHIGLVMVIAFLLYPLKEGSKWLRVIDYLGISILISSIVYLHYSYGTLMERIGYENLWDTLFGTIFIVVLLELCRRVVGFPLMIIALLFICYAIWGNIVPGFYGHEGYPLSRIVTTMFLTTEGVFGSALGAAATFVAIFIIFGTFLEKSGGSQSFIDLTTSIGGRKRGGPAKVAVLSSALTGSINGSAVANVSSTGVFTIPLMKKVGYTPKIAGSIEAVASTGGSILPPIMGSGAFVMSEMAGIPYSTIILACAIPSILYYFSIYFVVDFEAAKNNIGQLSEDEIPKLKETLKRGLLFIIPLAVLIFCIVILKLSIVRSGLYSILSILLISLFNPKGRIDFKNFIDILSTSAKRMILVSIACATAGLIVGVITLSGLGLKLSGTLMEVGQNSLFLTLVLTMIGAIVIGMGLPSTPAYIVFSVLSVPALVNLGVPLLTAHLFVFYFASFAPITPPVALASYAAAGISGSNPLGTAMQSFIFGLPAFVIPFMIIYGPELIGQGTAVNIIIGFISGCLGVMAFAGCTTSWFLDKLNYLERFVMLSIGVLLIIPGIITDSLGLGLLAVIIFIKFFKKRNLKIIPSRNVS